MKLLNFTIIKLTLCLIAGIIIASLYNFPLNVLIYGCFGLLILLLVSLIISKNKFQKTIWFGTIAFLTMVFIGILIVNLHDQRKSRNHYSKFISEEISDPNLITFKVREVLKPTDYHHKYVIDILKVDDLLVSGKVLLNVQKDSLSSTLQVDDILVSHTDFSTINKPLNPYQFDYSKYLQKLYIDHQMFVENRSLLRIRSEPFTLLGYAAAIRHKIDQRLKSHNFKPDELAIIDALLLGQRKDISQDTYNSYVNAGAIHILAVSGLHVGIILYLLQWLFKPVERLRHGNYVKIILIATILWGFAIIAGLSPSVTRAVSMFTVVAIGLNLKRPANIYNTLAISMFFLLLFKPMFLYDVGFQMSYVAVLAIVTIQPIILSLWKPKNKLVNYYWKLLSVTTAAQIGVVPISLYYFHQFPGLFFLSNLVILPFLGFILGFGIVVIILALINILPFFMADIYGFCIDLMNNFIGWVSHQESFVFRNISFGILFLIVSYVMIISLLFYLRKPEFRRLVFILLTVILFQGAVIFEKNKSHTNEFVIFQKNRYSLIGIKTNDRLIVADNLDSLTKEKDNVIKNYKVGNSIATIDNSKLHSVYKIEDKSVLIVDSLGVYNVKTFNPDYVCLRNSPKINLNRLIDSIQPKLIIADGSNYKSYVLRWKETCEAQKIPLHITSEKGAFIFKY